MVDADEIDDRIRRLRRTYGAFPVESETSDLSPEAYERARELHEQGIPGAARVWVERDREVLLVRTAAQPDSWGVPGGLIEPGERADRAGEREVREETGLECDIVDVAYVHRATRRHEFGDRPAFDELAVAFVATDERGAVRPQESEIREAAWWTRLPENSRPPATRLGPDRLAAGSD